MRFPSILLIIASPTTIQIQTNDICLHFKDNFFFFFLKNAGINKLVNARSDVTIQRGKTRFGINKEHPSNLDSGNLTKTYPQNSLFIKLVYVINFIIFLCKFCFSIGLAHDM
jgi:hypothetical protein